MMTPQQLVSDVENLVTLPEIYFRIRQSINDPASSINDVANVVIQDPNIAARVLRISNSAFFGFASEIKTVTRAISIMGLSQLHDLVLATSVVQAFKGVPNDLVGMRKFWARSVLCGALSRLLAIKFNMLDSERLFVTGVLHDIGHLIIFMKIPDQATYILARAKTDHVPLFQVEREVLGFDYAQVGGALLRSWKLHETYVEAVEFHTDLKMAAQYPLDAAIIHLANVLALRDEAAKSDVFTAPPVDRMAWQLTNLTEDDLPGIRTEAEKNVSEILSLFFK